MNYDYFIGQRDGSILLDPFSQGPLLDNNVYSDSDYDSYDSNREDAI